MRHWQQIAISACEQCQRNIVPQVNRPTLLNRWLSATDSQNQQLKLVLTTALRKVSGIFP